MPYCNDIEHFPGGINLFKVNNEYTRAKFYKLEQSFSQRFSNTEKYVIYYINFY